MVDVQLVGPPPPFPSKHLSCFLSSIPCDWHTSFFFVSRLLGQNHFLPFLQAGSISAPSPYPPLVPNNMTSLCLRPIYSSFNGARRAVPTAGEAAPGVREGGHRLLVRQDHASCSTIFSLWNLITLCGLTVWKFMQHSALNNNNRL